MCVCVCGLYAHHFQTIKVWKWWACKRALLMANASFFGVVFLIVGKTGCASFTFMCVILCFLLPNFTRFLSSTFLTFFLLLHQYYTWNSSSFQLLFLKMIHYWSFGATESVACSKSLLCLLFHSLYPCMSI